MGIKKDLTLGALTLLLGGIAAASYATRTPAQAADLACSDISGCAGNAHCDGPGTESAECVLKCEKGGYISCAIIPPEE